MHAPSKGCVDHYGTGMPGRVRLEYTADDASSICRKIVLKVVLIVWLASASSFS